MNGHGGEQAMEVLGGYGAAEIFTLNGGHIWPFYDACRNRGIPVYDTRHEATATFAAEGMARLTGRPAVAILTAGPGVTNGTSGVATAQANGVPLVVLGGRAPHGRWGSGSLQEFDHVPVMAPLTKVSTTATDPTKTAALLDDAVRTALSPHQGPVFVDFPMDALFAPAEVEVPTPSRPTGIEPNPDDVTQAAQLLAQAERPVLLAGSDVWLNQAHAELVAAVEHLRIPTFMNGLGRGLVAADHELAFSRTRSAMKEADVVCIVGTPLDFRLSFGKFGEARVIHIVDSPAQRAGHVEPTVSPAGDLRLILGGLANHSGDRRDHEPWIAKLREDETARRAAETPELTADADPIHPARIYGELRSRLDRDAVVIGDGGDFVSYAGRLVDSYQPGCWLDPGPLGCLGTGLGYAMAARVARPDKQVVLMLGDGAAGFSLMDVDSLVRHNLPVVMIVGNNGIWALEKHPMQAIYGWDVACDLRPGTRYDEVVKALGGAGETVERPADIGPAIDRALASGVPYMVNVLTDPAVQYPRTSNLG